LPDLQFGMLGALEVHRRQWNDPGGFGNHGAFFWKFSGTLGAKVRHSRGAYIILTFLYLIL